MSPDLEAPSSGQLMPDGSHRFPVRIYYADTDAGGVVYHGNYLALAERARTEMMRAAGFARGPLLEEGGIAFAVRSMEVDYQAPARLDDALVIVTRVLKIGGASLHVEQRFTRAGRDLVTILLRLVCIDRRFQAVRVPDELRSAFNASLAHDKSVTTGDGRATPDPEGVQS